MREHMQQPQQSAQEPSGRKAETPAPGLGNRDLLGARRAAPASVLSEMSQRMGADFSDVELYESPLVAQHGAQAAASGSKVAFAPGMLDFSSQKGLSLLGHELSHVASQSRGEVSGSGLVQDSALEHKADAEGARAAASLSPMSQASPQGGAGALQCKK